MRNLFRVVFVLYVPFLAACAWMVATDNGGGGPYQIAGALRRLAAGPPRPVGWDEAQAAGHSDGGCRSLRLAANG